MAGGVVGLAGCGQRETTRVPGAADGADGAGVVVSALARAAVGVARPWVPVTGGVGVRDFRCELADALDDRFARCHEGEHELTAGVVVGDSGASFWRGAELVAQLDRGFACAVGVAGKDGGHALSPRPRASPSAG